MVRLFLKILFFIFTMIVTAEEVKASAADNILQMWQHEAFTKNTYVFTYDKLNRLTGNKYEGASATPYNNFTEQGLTYDKNGNIKTLKRYDGAATLITDAICLHDGNRLTHINSTLAYGYDTNGNMNTDHRKDVNVVYNLLNLPHKVTRDDTVKATYIYLADGTKLGVEANIIPPEDPNLILRSNTMGFDYLGSMVYNSVKRTRTLESTSFGGGRINATNSDYEIDYFITDHLGSTRVIVDNAGNIKEQNDYYPFGMKHENSLLMVSSNRWGYNNKEKQTIFAGFNLLDYGNRMYDPELGRWFVQDMLQEKYYPFSSYVYCLNNALKYIDPDGRKIVIAGKNREAVYQDLALIYGTDMGRDIINKLHDSKTTYTIRADANKIVNSTYDYRKGKKNISYYHGELKHLEGTTFYSHEVLGHELYHAYQDETVGIKKEVESDRQYKNALEYEAVKFENYLRKVYGTGLPRLQYSGDRLFAIGVPKSFDTNGERRDINSVRFYVDNIAIGDSSNNNEYEVGTQDNTRVNNMQIFVNRVFEYMNANGLEAVHITF